MVDYKFEDFQQPSDDVEEYIYDDYDDFEAGSYELGHHKPGRSKFWAEKVRDHPADRLRQEAFDKERKANIEGAAER